MGKRSGLAVLIVVLVALPGWGAKTAPAAPAAGRCFPETGKCVATAFYDYWLANGGLARLGFPISDEFAESSPTDGRTYVVQYFERARFEHHPENAPPDTILLGLLGREQFLARYPNGRPPTAAPGDGVRCFPETNRCVSPRFLSYWLANGGLARLGFPISDEFAESSPTDGRTYVVQYFERARFEHHPENAPPDTILLGLLGREQFGSRYPDGLPREPSSPSPPVTPSPTRCDASYPGVCIPPPPPVLACGEIPYRNFAVVPPDPHRLDPDGNGIGCESR